MTAGSDFELQVQDLLSAGELSLVLERLLNFARARGATELTSELLVQSAALHKLRRDERLGVLSDELVARKYARLTRALSETLHILEDRYGPELVTANSHVEIEPDQLEKIFGLSHLKGIAWLARGLLAARSVGRVVRVGSAPTLRAHEARPIGTAFLLDGGLLITSRHVLPDPDCAANALVQFGYEEDVHGVLLTPASYRLDAGSLRVAPTLDVCCVAVLASAAQPSLSTWGGLSLGQGPPPEVGDHVSIIQHPDGAPKKIALTANQVVDCFEHNLQYLTDTLPGSSGSPVFDDSWRVVAVHRRGGNLVTSRAGTKRFANEGILSASVIAELDLTV